MKNKYKIIYAVAILSLLIVGVFFAFLPDQVPVHFGMTGEVNRFGSKYEYAVFPLIVLLMTVFIVAAAKNQNKKKAYSNEKVVVISGISGLSIFNLVEIYILLKAATYSTALPLIDVFKLSALVIGVLLIIIGNIMPKATLNATFGLRTVWSMKNEEVWQKCQRFGGYFSIISGFLTILSGIFLSGYAVLIFMIVLMLLVLVVCIAGSHRIYKEWLRKDATNKNQGD